MKVSKTYHNLNFKDFNLLPCKFNGERYCEMFDNGYGVSIIRNEYSYGGNKGLYEVGILEETNDTDELTELSNGSYATTKLIDNPSNVIGYLTENEVNTLMRDVAVNGKDFSLPSI